MLSPHVGCRSVCFWLQTIRLRFTAFKIHAYTPCEITGFLRTRPRVQRITSLPDTKQHFLASPLANCLNSSHIGEAGRRILALFRDAADTVPAYRAKQQAHGV